MDYLFLIATGLATLALLEALASLKGGFEFRRTLERARQGRGPAFTPPATLIVPCRGLDPGFEENLRAFFALDYPDFQLLLVAGEREDPCVAPIVQLVRELSPGNVRLLLAGEARDRGQKVHNLLHAVRFLRQSDEAIAFGDSDIRPHPAWLQALVSGLADPDAAVVSGFRWYLPQEGNFASVLRSVWNAGAVSLMKERGSRFAWGGAMALSRRTFEECRVEEHWARALSDDLALSAAVRARGKSIHFQPLALSFTHEDCSLLEFLDWSRRQMLILRVCHPRLWRLALAAQMINVAGLWGGLVTLLVTGGGAGPSPPLLALLLGCIYILGCCKAWLRTDAVRNLFPGRAAEIDRHWWAYVFCTPLASLASLAALIRSATGRDIEWRGIRYRLHGPDRTEIL